MTTTRIQFQCNIVIRVGFKLAMNYEVPDENMNLYYIKYTY